MKRRSFLKAVSVSAVAAHAAGCASAERRAGLKRVPVVSKPDGGGDPRIRGPFPILSTPFEESGAVDFKTLAGEARFVEKCGCKGMIWPQSGDSCDLLSVDEKLAGMEAIARELENSEAVVAFGCQGRGFEDARACAEFCREARLKIQYPRGGNLAPAGRRKDGGGSRKILSRARKDGIAPDNHPDRRGRHVQGPRAVGRFALEACAAQSGSFRLHKRGVGRQQFENGARGR